MPSLAFTVKFRGPPFVTTPAGRDSSALSSCMQCQHSSFVVTYEWHDLQYLGTGESDQRSAEQKGKDVKLRHLRKTDPLSFAPRWKNLRHRRAQAY